jgi:dCMP deaminase
MYRPTDDQLFMATAEVAASRSLCSRARVGAVIVSMDARVIATGRNGPPQFFPHNEQPCTEWCPRAIKQSLIDLAESHLAYPAPDSTYDDCVAIHAEANALLSSDRALRLGGMMYVTGEVCYSCAKLIANSGISYLIIGHTFNATDTASWRGSHQGYDLLQSTQTNVYHLNDKELIPWVSP